MKPPIAPILALIAYFCAESWPACISRRIDIRFEQHLIKKIPTESALLPIVIFVLFQLQRHQDPVPTNRHMFETAYIFFYPDSFRLDLESLWKAVSKRCGLGFTDFVWEKGRFM